MQSNKKNNNWSNSKWGKSKIGSTYEKWPKPNGEPEAPVFLTHCSSTDLQDQLLLGMLEAYGIPSVTKYPNDGTFGKVVLGISGDGVDIYVPQSLLKDAKALTGGNLND